MLPTILPLNSSDSKNSCLMDDLEVGIPYYEPRPPNKKMKTRKQLDALLKFRSTSVRSSRTNNRVSNENLVTSEDELFLPDQHNKPKKMYTSRYRRWCHYVRHILSFCFVCIFMIVCVGLAYANIELKSEVQNLSLRVSEIEKRFSSVEINRVLFTIDQIKTRLYDIERWNVSYLYDRFRRLQKDLHKLQAHSNSFTPDSTEVSMNDDDVSTKLTTMEQKSKDFRDIAQELEILSHDADQRVEGRIDEKNQAFNQAQIDDFLHQEQRENAHSKSIDCSKNIRSLNETIYLHSARWQTELNSLRSEFHTANQTGKIEEFANHLIELTNLMQNSSSKTTAILSTLQTELNQLRSQINACKCPKEPIPLKPSVVDSNQLQQSSMTKPNPLNAPILTSTKASIDVYIEANIDKNISTTQSIDISEIVNQNSSAIV